MAQKSRLVGVAILYTVLTSILGVGRVAKQGKKFAVMGNLVLIHVYRIMFVNMKPLCLIVQKL